MRKFNFLFNKIVRDEKDLVGIVAYSFYKKQKKEYIEGIEKDKEKKVDEISESDLQSFVSISNTDTQLESYRSEATKYLKDYADILMQEKLEDIETHYKKLAVTNFWSGVRQSVVGSFAFVAIIGLLVFILQAVELGPKDVIENVFNVDIQKKVMPIKEEGNQAKVD